jgi:hypothetical protein
MSKALVTFATGTYTAFLDIARPSFMAYAERHGYDYIESSTLVIPERPPSWSKIPVLLNALATHDAALWIDCDAVIVDGTEDIANCVPTDAWQAMALHHTHRGFDMGELPVTGTWFVRKPMIPVLAQMWGMAQYTNALWWEQAAMHELLGYYQSGEAVFPVRKGPETELRRNTHFLEEKWTCAEYAYTLAVPRIMHVPSTDTFEHRLCYMRFWAERALYDGKLDGLSLEELYDRLFVIEAA